MCIVVENELSSQLKEFTLALTAHSDVKDYLRMRANTGDSCFARSKNFVPWFKTLFLFPYKSMKA